MVHRRPTDTRCSANSSTAGLEHFDYVNTDAPKGGSYRYASQGVSFDSLNQIALLGTIPPSLLFMTDTLMKQSRDEPASYYCLVCTT
jgi:microcin C transport system substrate-binding protein